MKPSETIIDWLYRRIVSEERKHSKNKALDWKKITALKIAQTIGENFISKEQHEKELDKMREDWTNDIHRVCERKDKESQRLQQEKRKKHISVGELKIRLKETERLTLQKAQEIIDDFWHTSKVDYSNESRDRLKQKLKENK